MKKYLIVLFVLLLPVLIFPQTETNTNKEEKKVTTNIPVLAQYSNKFAIKNLNFNKRTDYSGKGEILEVEFVLENLTDEPMDLYLFTIATFEKVEKTKSSLERPIPFKEQLRTFVPYPDDISNFQYPDTDQNGNPKKDDKGVDILKLVKFPKNPKAGVDPYTSKPYHLYDKLVIRTNHLSKYRRNYFYFNEVAVLIFDNEGKPAFRKLFSIKGKRNR